MASVHNKRREEGVEHAIRVYSNSSESNMTSCLAHMISANAFFCDTADIFIR